MKFNRALKSRILLAIMVSLLLYSFSYPPALQKDFEKDVSQVQLKENVEDSDHDWMRSSNETLSQAINIGNDYCIIAVASFHDQILKVWLTHFKVSERRFKSTQKIYLQLLRLLI